MQNMFVLCYFFFVSSTRRVLCRFIWSLSHAFATNNPSPPTTCTHKKNMWRMEFCAIHFRVFACPATQFVRFYALVLLIDIYFYTLCIHAFCFNHCVVPRQMWTYCTANGDFFLLLCACVCVWYSSCLYAYKIINLARRIAVLVWWRSS